MPLGVKIGNRSQERHSLVQSSQGITLRSIRKQKNISHGLIFEQHARGTVGRVIHLPWGYGRQGYVGEVILRCVAQKCLDTLSKFGIVLPE